MVVGADGALPLPWLAAPLREACASHRGHALLVHAAPGFGALPFVLTLAQAWLCEEEGDGTPGPCGRCGSCRLVQAHLHPDLLVLLPESLRREHDWLLALDKAEVEEGKRKPSRQIRIDEVRFLIDWSTKTSGRGRGKVAVLHPAEALNLQAASALLKTLEEPPAGTRLLLTCTDPQALLATMRSRCQHLRLPPPGADVALGWLAGQGVAQGQVLLQACDGRPLEALALARSGVDAPTWAALPQAVAEGRAAALAGWPLPRALDALQKICHDALASAVGGAGRYFPAPVASGPPQLQALLGWADELGRVAQHADHPWHEGLLVEALVALGARALAPAVGGASTRHSGMATLQA